MTSVAMLSASVSRAGGGVSVAMQNLSKDLAAAGVDVRVFASPDVKTGEDLAAWGNISVSLHRRRGVSVFGILEGLSHAIEDFDPDIIHLHGLWTEASVNAVLSGRSGVRRVVSPHGMLDPWALRNSGWKKRIARTLLENRNLRNAALLHALNSSERDAIRALGFRTPVAIVPNGISLPDLKIKPRLPERLNLGSRRIMLFLGRIHPKKGLRETIEAWHLSLKSNRSTAKDWQLVIAGWDDGNHLAALENLVEDLDLKPHVHFLGPVFGAEKATLLANAEAFILASHSEGLPMAILEACSYSVPVLMTPECNFPEGFDAGAAIRLTCCPEEISKVLNETMHMTSSDLHQIGAKGRALMARRYSRERVADAMIQAYDWALNRGVAPDHIDVGLG